MSDQPVRFTRTAADQAINLLDAHLDELQRMVHDFSGDEFEQARSAVLAVAFRALQVREQVAEVLDKATSEVPGQRSVGEHTRAGIRRLNANRGDLWRR